MVSDASTWPAPGYAVAVGATALGAWKLFRALLNSAAHSGKGTGAFHVVRAVKARQVSGAIHGDDYPSSALRAGAEGRCVVDFTVDVTGLVNDVQLVESSGHRALDEAACNFIAKRFQFEPARGSDGVAIAERRHQPVVWRLPHDSSAEPV